MEEKKGGQKMGAMLGQNIERLRKERRLTQEQVAGELGMSRPTYINIESGERDLGVSELERLAAIFKVSASEILGSPRNNEKFEQMYFYILRKFRRGVPKTKLAKMLYLADFSYFYDNLKPMSGVVYIRRDYGPVADIFFETTDKLFDSGKIRIKPLDRAMMIEAASLQESDDLLNDGEKRRLDEIVEYWGDRSTQEIVNFTHEQKPWQSRMDGEEIPYISIIQEDPKHVYTSGQ